MVRMPGALLAFVLASAMLIWDVPVTALTIPSGRDKDAWPELLHEDWEVAKAALESSGFVQNVYVQHPGGSRPANIGSPADIWLYTDGSTTYEIPRRGVWHPNRLVPGWPELTGTFYTAAIAKIKSDYLGVTVIYSPKGSPVYTTEIRMDRVIVSINSTDGTVLGVPSVY
ncbi:uncharacterized protein [Physcomitrium patens]|uniref:uncharacterized protein n=1 Tax=Physcomitrium patens TaxID=3218 RepID=UPI00024AD925|nr:uncharacterized protein LOC112275787 isoform X1 [Physcomitrium patens]|eukprot:XP_024362195.1 uncharacterized protein LOC112275787 isoform X1 [Physcomitrella patens]